MTKECLGCGSVLQTESPGKEGFVKSSVYDKSSYCERCFKIKHYGEYSVLDKKIDTDGIVRNINSDILISSKIPDTFLTRKYELISSKIYDLICETNTYKFELSNKPIRKENKDIRKNTKL